MMKRYDLSFKIDAVILADEVGNTKAAKELGIPIGTLNTWVHKAKKGELDTSKILPKTALTLAEENKRLQQEIRELKRINKVLKDASAFFAQSQKK